MSLADSSLLKQRHTMLLKRVKTRTHRSVWFLVFSAHGAPSACGWLTGVVSSILKKIKTVRTYMNDDNEAKV